MAVSTGDTVEDRQWWQSSAFGLTPDGHCGTVHVKEKTTSTEIATCVATFKDASKCATSSWSSRRDENRPTEPLQDRSETIRKNPVADHVDPSSRVLGAVLIARSMIFLP